MQNADQPDRRPGRSMPGDVAGFDQPDSAWNRVVDVGEHADPFCCRTEWQLSFHETFPGARQRPLHVRERAGSVIAFAERRQSAMGPLLEPVETNWLFGCPLLGNGAVALLDELLRERADDPVAPGVLISGLLPGSALVEQLVDTFAERYEFFSTSPNELVTASLAGGFDGYLSRRSGRLRRNVRQQARRAAEQGVYFERCAPTGVAVADRTFARMLAVERRSWKGIGRCGMAELPSRKFYRAMLRRMAVAGIGRVVFARHGDDDIGFIFGGLTGPCYRGQQFSFVEPWRHAAIGNLLQLEQVRWLTEEGVAIYHMGPAMPYKRHWTERTTRADSWLLRPR